MSAAHDVGDDRPKLGIVRHAVQHFKLGAQANEQGRIIQRWAERFGYGRKTGIDLPTERTGTFPGGNDWYKKRFGWNPTPSEVMSLAIGQGPNSQTPLRMAQFFAALAGNGTSARPGSSIRPLRAQVPTYFRG